MFNPTFMHRCLDLGALGRRDVGNGAMVGAVLVREGKIIAEGYHQGFGSPHAERSLLETFKGFVDPNDVLYVNLEPCVHWGKTPPCVDIIIKKGIKHVVYGMQDPDERVKGKGIQQLRDSDVEVVGPLERAQCEYFNKGFLSVRTVNRPWVTIKMALNRAKQISKTDGRPLKITSPKRDEWSHTFLRRHHDAILVGVGTIEKDDSLLDTRFAQKFYYSQTEGVNDINNLLLNTKNVQSTPWKIILDPTLRISLQSKVITHEPGNCILCISPDSSDRKMQKIEEFQQRGVQVFSIPLESSNFAWNDFFAALLTPRGSYPGLTSLLVEGGKKTWEIFAQAGLQDELVILTE